MMFINRGTRQRKDKNKTRHNNKKTKKRQNNKTIQGTTIRDRTITTTREDKEDKK